MGAVGRAVEALLAGLVQGAPGAAVRLSLLRERLLAPALDAAHPCAVVLLRWALRLTATQAATGHLYMRHTVVRTAAAVPWRRWAPIHRPPDTPPPPP